MMKYGRSLARQTKIVCTIGPASSSTTVIERLIKAGMNVARLNLSHGAYEEHTSYIREIRKISQRLGINVSILIDLPGPKYRVGKLQDNQAILEKGSQVVLTTRQVAGNATLLPVNISRLPQDVHKGDTVLIDDGAVKLRVLMIAGTEVKCQVMVGGMITDGRGLVVPGMLTSGAFVTDALERHIRFAIQEQPDYLALSFVSKVQDVTQVRAVLKDSSADIPIIAKIERGIAVTNFSRILAASDGIMVARGDLGVDIPLERVPLVQKEIIRKCNQVGKPVITATQMLESMVDSFRPTRAEVTDVANAIFDGTDATMLSAETSVGKYPVQATRMMSKIARQTESGLPYERILAEKGTMLEHKTEELISYNACLTAQNLGAVAIMAFTQSGSTAERVSKFRPRVPVLAISPSNLVCGKLMLWWGIYPFRIARVPSVNELFVTAANLAKEVRLAKSNDLIVITGGLPIGIAGSTNLLKVERIS
jgi:pyruvate kinase